MIRRLLLLVAGGLTLSFLILANTAQAAPTLYNDESPCPEPSDCLVPTPTLIQPDNAFDYSNGNEVLVTGLSWNETKVDVYIDGAYNGRAELRIDPSEIGNFHYKPTLSLNPGEHNIYTIARNLSEKERSPQSPIITFSVLRRTPTVATGSQPGKEEPIVKGQSTEVDSEDSAVSDEEVPSANEVLDEFFGESDSEGATTTATTTNVLGRGFRILFGILIAAIVIIIIIIRVRGKNGGAPPGTDETLPRDQHLPLDEMPPPGAP